MRKTDTGIVRVVGNNGEVFIPKSIRETLGIQPDTVMEISIVDGGVCFTPCSTSCEK